jgi:hypothetical protein
VNSEQLQLSQSLEATGSSGAVLEGWPGGGSAPGQVAEPLAPQED